MQYLDANLKNDRLHHSRVLYDPLPRILEIKAKINKWDLIKLKSFCTTNKTLSKVKRQPSEWEKIIANEATDKQLISRIYKQLLQLNSRKISDPIKKWAKELNRHFSKEDTILIEFGTTLIQPMESPFTFWANSWGPFFFFLLEVRLFLAVCTGM